MTLVMFAGRPVRRFYRSVLGGQIRVEFYPTVGKPAETRLVSSVAWTSGATEVDVPSKPRALRKFGVQI